MAASTGSLLFNSNVRFSERAQLPQVGHRLPPIKFADGLLGVLPAIRHAGYTNVYWYRGGREAWEVAGKPEDVVRPADW